MRAAWVIVFGFILNAFANDDRYFSYRRPCIEKVLELYPRTKYTVLFTNLNGTFKGYPTIRTNNFSYLNWLRKSETHIYILRIDPDEMQKFLTWDAQRRAFDPKSLYLILTKNASSRIFEMFVRHYIRNAIIINDTLSMFTYFPYIYENANNPETTPTLIGNCEKNLIDQSFFKDKEQLWRNTTVRQCYRLIGPYTDDKDGGLENKLLLSLRDVLKYNVKTVILEDDRLLEEQDYLSEEGLRQLETHEADVMVGFSCASVTTIHRFDVSHGYYIDTTHWIAPGPRMLSYWTRIKNIYSILVWICIFLGMVVWILLTRRCLQVNVVKLIMMLIHLALENSINTHQIHQKFSMKIMISVWLMAFVILNTVFKNSLLVILGTDQTETPLNSMSGILKSNLTLNSNFNLSEKYIDPKHRLEYPIAFNRVGKCRDVLECVNRTAFQRNSVTTAPKGIVRYSWIPRYYINLEKREVLVKVTGARIMNLHVQLYCSKGYPLFPQMYKFLMDSTSNGYFERIYAMMQRRVRGSTRTLILQSEKIGLDKFNFVFVIWGIGLAVSLGVFCAEIVAHKHRFYRAKRIPISATIGCK